jgi:hypothetical protein
MRLKERAIRWERRSVGEYLAVLPEERSAGKLRNIGDVVPDAAEVINYQFLPSGTGRQRGFGAARNI